MPTEQPEDRIYMTDDTDMLRETIESRKDKYPPDLKERWSDAIPEVKNGELIWQLGWPPCFYERVLYVEGHEVMSNYQYRYMRKMAEIVTRNGGDILEVGYGLGLATREIEKWRQRRRLQTHFVLELNRRLADEARKLRDVTVVEGDYTGHVPELDGKQFDGVIYDGYPLKEDEMHRDGVLFIERLVRDRLLRSGGILTFYANAAEELGQRFRAFLKELGFTTIETEKVRVTPPKRKRQIWRQNHFLAPMARLE